MLHRIGFAMALADSNPLTSIVEVDETYIGGKPRNPGEERAKWTSKVPVMAMIRGMMERYRRMRPKVIVDVTAKTLQFAPGENVDRRARIMTDKQSSFPGIGRFYDGGQETVNHSEREYAQGDVSTKTVEGFFSVLKRGLNGMN